MSQKPSLNRLMEFQKFLLAFRSIERTLHIPPGTERFENDTEHSYNLAMFAWFLAPYFPKLDQDALIRTALAHDLVEVHAGDTFAYSDEETLKQKHVREAAALEQLKKEWPDFPELTKTIAAYEARGSEEAKFIYALDKLIPALVDYMNEGRGWHDRVITFEDFVRQKNKKIPISPEIDAYSQELIRILEKQPHLFPTRPGSETPSQQR